MSDFKFTSRFSEAEKLDAEILIHEGIISDKNTTEIINDLENENLTYRNTNMLRDIRRAKSDYYISLDKEGDKSFNLLSGESKDKSNQWFENVFEPFRKEHGLDSDTAFRILKQERDTSHKLIKDAKLGQDYSDRYMKIFGDN